MKEYKVEFLDLAREDLLDIQEYYDTFFSDKSGQKIMGKILKAVKQLKSFPYSGTLVEDEKLLRQEYRMIFAGAFVIIYRITGDQVMIYHVADTRRQYNKLFKF